MTGSGFRVQGSGFSILVLTPILVLVLAPVLVLVPVVLVLVLSASTVYAQAPDPEALYTANCSSCHDQPQGRTPPREALKERAPEAILTAITSGSMAVQAINIAPADKRRLAEFLAGKPFSATATEELAGLCTTKPAPIGDLKAKPYWNGWGVDATNSRYQPKPGISAADVPNLKLKWAFGFPKGTQAYGNPVIVSGRVFVGSDSGTLYALDAESGCMHWSFKAESGIRSAPSVGRAGNKDAVYFGDLRKRTSSRSTRSPAEVIWKKQVRSACLCARHRRAHARRRPALCAGVVGRGGARRAAEDPVLHLPRQRRRARRGDRKSDLEELHHH